MSDSISPAEPIGPRSGYTLPVFACAAALAALRYLQGDRASVLSVAVDLITPAQTVEIPIEQVASIKVDTALAITRSDPGDNLDITRHTPIWAVVSWATDSAEPIVIEGGEGIGRLANADYRPSINAYARRLLLENLRGCLQPGERIHVTIILPEGRALAERTSNAAFGVVEGLSLLGTSGIAQPLSAPGQLEQFRQTLQQKAERYQSLVFCVGENGLALAQQIGVQPDRLIKTANWLGSMLVEAGLQNVRSIVLLGYHGKLIKLAAGIFHTHHYVADARQEILTAYCANAGLSTAACQTVLHSPTAEAALTYLRHLDRDTGSQWVKSVYGLLVEQIDARSHQYISVHSERSVQVGSVLFDRDRQILMQSQTGASIFSEVC